MTLLKLHGLAKVSIFQGWGADPSAPMRKVLHTRNSSQDQDRVIFSRRKGFPGLVTTSSPVQKLSPKGSLDLPGDICCLLRWGFTGIARN